LPTPTGRKRWIGPVPPALDRAAGWSWRLLACVLAVAAVLALLWYLKVIVLPTIVALTLAPALMPIARFVRKRLGVHRPAAALALLAGLVLVGGLIAVVALSVVSQYDELAEAVRSGVSEITDWLEGEPFNLSSDRVSNLDSSLGDVWANTSSYLVAGLTAGGSLLAGLVLAVAMLYFVLRDGPEIWRRVVGRFPHDRAPAVDRAGQRAWKVLDGYIRGTALIAFIDAALIGIGIWLLGVPLALPLAVLVFLGGFVPFVGATVSGLVAVLVAFADEGWEIALVTLGIVIGVQLIEGNFLQPIIQSRTVDLHPAVILLAVAAGGSLFGILGAYLAVPVTAVVFALVTALAAERAAQAREAPAPASPTEVTARPPS
jgi:predicted PurR-regulated permease PerM